MSGPKSGRLRRVGLLRGVSLSRAMQVVVSGGYMSIRLHWRFSTLNLEHLHHEVQQ